MQELTPEQRAELAAEAANTEREIATDPTLMAAVVTMKDTFDMSPEEVAARDAEINQQRRQG